ncbi:unnamed protein product [Blepharisma stoltei]|uniref:Uncharacterized protein n=1 Tax=Blepharisma stoltei TaxID=1481888 RepID=A0AAU9JLG6_9CILI|nr:unnamed protein product [Blepharisma stoltei]
MNFCENKRCNCIGNAFCLCKSKFYCEKHLKEHLQAESKNHKFGFSYNNPDLTTKDDILSFLDSLIVFKKRHKYSQIISSIEEGSCLMKEWYQKLKKIVEDIDYYQFLIIEIGNVKNFL